eukprot:5848861-Lingulodinium_polyedra.AAC.1
MSVSSHSGGAGTGAVGGAAPGGSQGGAAAVRPTGILPPKAPRAPTFPGGREFKPQPLGFRVGLPQPFGTGKEIVQQPLFG